MQLTAKLIQLLPLQTGASKNGEWKKQDIIVETDGQFSKKICISVWGDRIDYQFLEVGNQLTIDFDIESREYNGRWFTDVKAWKISMILQDPTNDNTKQINTGLDFLSPEEDNLPF